MLFNTPNYVIFFLVVACVVILTNKFAFCKTRNAFLLVASYVFYGMLHVYYPILLLYVTLINYWGGRVLYSCAEQNRKRIISVVIIFSILPLCFLKYAPMYVGGIWLPVGLSFFTFQALTYSLDVYRRKIEAPFTVLDVFLFVAFFPTLLSGPIERARNLIPQLRHVLPINWNNTIDGAQLFVWGAFKKMLADRLAEWVDMIYAQGSTSTGGTLAVAAVLYSFQIYCDFSGYASMAIGSGRMLGIRLMNNFNYPYFAVSFKDFWRRWHISLTTWFTEYVYISMGGNRVSIVRWVLNITVVFLLSGIWHGAALSFVIWGALHAVMYLVEHFTHLRDKWGLYRIVVFIGVTVAWVFFRVEDTGLALEMIAKMFTGPWFPIAVGAKLLPIAAATIGLLFVFLIVELALYRNWVPSHWLLQSVGFAVLIVAIALFAVSNDQFVYFKF